MKAALQNYQARMRRVLDHIDRHLDGDLDLETVSGIAAFSKFHFDDVTGAIRTLADAAGVTMNRLPGGIILLR
jgi:ferric-dicitrate binding protein FerR (iron transport regulator)